MEHNNQSQAPGISSPVLAGLNCKCPQCGLGSLFKGLFSLDVGERCNECGLEYKFIDSGDGPAVFAIFILGFLILGLALIVEFNFAPPLWVHIAIWTPATLLVALGLLRPLKGVLIALQFKHKAGQDRMTGE